MKFFEMTREEANQILSAIKDGNAYSEACTLECLYLTGDHNPHATVRSEGMDQEVSQEDWRGRVRAREALVGAGQGRHSKATWKSGAEFFGQANGGGAT
jgi:hypothetical protein